VIITILKQNRRLLFLNNEDYTLNINNYTIFGTKDSISQLKLLYKDSTSLFNLNFSITVGNIVWNQCKDILTDDATKTRLIYSSDISNNKLMLKKYKNKDKKNYIDKKGNNSPILVINRGYGTGNYKFEYCLINTKNQILIENHLIQVKSSLPNLILLMNSLNNKNTKKFIKLYFGNNAINTTELNFILPIYKK